ncbi:MAG: HIT family protein [Candidatus Micrarchaeales archaeon]|nr:HIT family protein [Candidatus Micrarchaeales archaeon]
MKGCKFCEDDIRKKGVVYEDKLCYVVPSGYPRAFGHLLVISKKHFSDMASMDKKTLLGCFYVAHRLLPKMKKALKARGIYVIVDSEGAEEIYHFHIHLIPNYKEVHRKRFAYLSYKKISDADRSSVIKLLKMN